VKEFPKDFIAMADQAHQSPAAELELRTYLLSFVRSCSLRSLLRLCGVVACKEDEFTFTLTRPVNDPTEAEEMNGATWQFTGKVKATEGGLQIELPKFAVPLIHLTIESGMPVAYVTTDVNGPQKTRINFSQAAQSALVEQCTLCRRRVPTAFVGDGPEMHQICEQCFRAGILTRPDGQQILDAAVALHTSDSPPVLPYPSSMLEDSPDYDQGAE
jgi:hypothetical protein